MKTKLILMFVVLFGMLQAQTAVLDRFVVTATPIGELQLKQPIGRSGMGDSDSLLNTPRSVSTIDSHVMSQFNVDSIDKVASYTSNVQSVGSFGQSATVNVRGDLAETYVNNQRRTNNSFGFRPSFNTVEMVDVVHGAPSVVFGPGFYSGGYTNLITKKASREAFSEVRIQFQTLNEYGNKRVLDNNDIIMDNNIPLTQNSAVRFSYQTQLGTDTYNQDLFTTYNYANSKQSFTFNFEYSHQNNPEKIGVNRVTQKLIDTGYYISGTVKNPLDSSEVPNGPLVRLPRLATTMGQDDYAKADVWFGQAVYTNKLNGELTLHNLTLAEYVDRQRVASYEYFEFVRQSTFDNRTEFHFDKPKVYTIAGVEARYEYRKAECNYYNTFFNGWDISKGGAANASKRFSNFYYPGTVGMGGMEFFGPLDALFDTAESKLWTVSAFIQQRLKLSPKVQFVYGLRADDYTAYVSDPIGKTLSDSVGTTSKGYTTSLIYSVNPLLSLYATFNHLEAVNASVTGGAIVFGPDYQVAKKNFHSLNKLYEVGARYQHTNTVCNLTAFWQYRQQHNFYVNEPDDIMVRGVELENKYQATKELFFITNLTYMEANVDNSFPYEFNGIGLPAISEPGNYRIPGLSRVYANQTISYNFLSNWTVGSTVLWQSEQSGNGLGGYHIPSQHSVNLHLSYGTDSWNARLTVYNVTDRNNWIHNGDFYGDNVVVSRELPARAEIAVTKRF